jgi:hypothetical protein
MSRLVGPTSSKFVQTFATPNGRAKNTSKPNAVFSCSNDEDTCKSKKPTLIPALRMEKHGEQGKIKKNEPEIVNSVTFVSDDSASNVRFVRVLPS